MSYILNALRKAEKEHLAGKNPDWLADSLCEQRTQKKYPGFWIIGTLILINLATLSFIIWYSWPDAESKPEFVGEKTEMFTGNESTVTELPMFVSDFVNAQEGLESKTGLQKEQEKKASSSFAEIVTARQVAKEKRLQHPREQEKQAPEGKLSSETESKQQKQTLSAMRQKSEPLPSENSSFRASFPADKISSRENLQDDVYIPTFKELPLDFRRNVPKININVFVYSEDVAEQFVVVDMVKHTPGSELAENMQLKKILNDSLVVEYRGKTFRIMRP